MQGQRFTIGKKASNNLVVDGNLVSREHCEIVSDGSGKYLLRDRGSRNGTFVNGYRVGADVLLQNGMEIAVGDVQMVFTTDGPGDRMLAAQAARKASRTVVQAQEAVPAQRREGKPIPVTLKKKIHSRLLERLDLKHEDFETRSSEEIRNKTVRAIRGIIEELSSEVPGWVEPDELIKEVADEALGLGPLEDMLADPEIDEIMVNSWDQVYVERHGIIEKSNKRFTDNEQVVNIVRRIISPIGRRIDESSPMVDARLPDGSRVNAIINPLALTGPTLTIRKFSAVPFTVDDLIGFGTMTRQIADFLQLAVRNRMNILISGGTGSGKTTLLNVVSCWIPERERIVTIEDAAELKLPQEHIVSLEAKPPNIRGEGAIPIRKLVINSLRMRPDRIIVGECRGGEALDMLQAMNTGHDGSLTTLHANSPRDSLSRLETMVLMAGMELPSRAVREQITSAINLIVHTARLPDGSRKIMIISEITDIRGDTIHMQDICEFRQRGFGAGGRVMGYFTPVGNVPVFVNKLIERGVEVDMGLFAPVEEEEVEARIKEQIARERGAKSKDSG